MFKEDATGVVSLCEWNFVWMELDLIHYLNSIQ